MIYFHNKMEPLSYLFLVWIYPPLYISRLVAMLSRHQKLVYNRGKPHNQKLRLLTLTCFSPWMIITSFQQSFFDKRDEFCFLFVSFPFLSGNIPSRPPYRAYILQLIRYAHCCSYYDDFKYHHKVLIERLLSQGYHPT